MKISTTSDLHLHTHTRFATVDENGMQTRFAEILKTVDYIVEQACQQGSDLLLIAGDIFHTHGSVKATVLNHVKASFLSWSKRIDIGLIAGNHDMENYNDTNIYSYMTTSLCKPFGVNNVYNLAKGDLASMGIYGIDYCKNIQDFKEALVNIPADAKVIVCHQGVDDFKPNPNTSDTGLTYDDFPKHPIIINGHYHNPKHYQNFIQVGSPLQHSFSDNAPSYGYWTIDLESQDIQFHEITHTPRFEHLTSAQQIKNLSPKRKYYLKLVNTTTSKLDKMIEAAKKQANILNYTTELIKEPVTQGKTIVEHVDDPKELLSNCIDASNNEKFKKNKIALMDKFEEVCLK